MHASQTPVTLPCFALSSFILPFMVQTDLCLVGLVKFSAMLLSSSACLICGILIVAPCGRVLFLLYRPGKSFSDTPDLPNF